MGMSSVSLPIIMLYLSRILFLFCFSFTSLLYASPPLLVTQFDQNSLSDWQEKSFKGHTNYEFTQLDGLNCLQATANASASGWFKEQKIDLKETPFLNWSWWVGDRLNGLNEQEKSGDDYVARLYVVIDGGWKIWNTKALNYVWSSNQAQFSEWNNAFVGANAKMLAVQGKDQPVRQWHYEKRNVYQDLVRVYGDLGSEQANEEAYRYIDAIALMTDTDNSERQASACYGAISFTAE